MPAAGTAEPGLDPLEDPGVMIQGLDGREPNAPNVVEGSVRFSHDCFEALIRLTHDRFEALIRPPPLLPAFVIGPSAFLIGLPALVIGSLAIDPHLGPQIAEVL
jgi:hypothetical protein